MDGLPERDLAMRSSCCEYFLPSDSNVPKIRKRYEELLSSCRELPATGSSRGTRADLSLLHDSVARLKSTTIGTTRYQRGEALKNLDRLCSLADRISINIERSVRNRETRKDSERLQRNGPIAMAPGTSIVMDPPIHEAQSTEESDGNVGLSVIGLRRRQRDATRELAAPATQLPQLRAVIPEPVLDELQQEALHAALRSAVAAAAQNGYLNEIERTRLGHAVTGAFGGAYPAHLAHNRDLGRRTDTVARALGNILARMQPAQADAVRRFAAQHYPEIGAIR